MTDDRQESVEPLDLNTVYRIVWTGPPTIEDFQPNIEKSIEARRISSDAARLHTGISVYRTWAQARRTARKRPPWLDQGFIAEIRIPIGSDARVERTTRSAGHYTLWADAGRVMEWVLRVEAVQEIQDTSHGL
jgi:hypothetical protein